MSAPAKCPAGRLNVLPAEGSSSGCDARRFSINSRISASMAAGSPGCKANLAETIDLVFCKRKTVYQRFFA